MKRSVREAVTSYRAGDPMRDETTRTWLVSQGFDLSAPISWWDDQNTNCRHFTQTE